jgi:hypothetical protein
MNDSQALARSVSCLLDNARPQATWGDFQVDWDPIITALTCKLLLSCGLTAETTWYVTGDGYARCTLADSSKWLNNSIRPDGTFGTDFWDAAQLAILVEVFSLHKQFTAYDSLKQHLTSAIRSRKFMRDPSQWQGPAFYAAAIEYSHLLGHRKEVDALAGELVSLQSHGCWQGHSGPSGALYAVWHTAQCIIALSATPVSHPEIVAKGIGWLKRAQHASGAWLSVQQYEIYFTAYAVLALLIEHKHERPELNKALEYLKSRMAPDGKCSDLGGTLMCAMALRAVVGDAFEKDITLVDYLLAKKNLARADASEARLRMNELELGRLQAELNRYEKKYGDADFAITKKQLFFLALVALFVTVFGTIAGVYGLNYALRTSGSSSPPQVIKAVESPTSEVPATPQTAPAKQSDSERQPTQVTPAKQASKAKQPAQTPPTKPPSEQRQ